MKRKIMLLLICLPSFALYAQSWKQLPGGPLNGNVYSICSFGGYLWVSGTFSQGGAVIGINVIRHDGFQWISTPTTNGTAFGFCIHNNELYALGGFDVGPTHYGIMKWNGSGWTPMAQLLTSDYMQTGTSYNGDLVVGGRFTIVDGIPIDYIAKWNGISWSALCVGNMENNSSIPEVKVLYSAKGCIYAGGAFSKICGVNTSNAAKWNGSTWIPLPIGGVTSYISLGSDVVVAGSFMVAGPAISQAIAKEDTVSVGDWLKLSPVDNGVKLNATSLAKWNNRLYVAGSHAIGGGGFDVWNCGYWDGVNWTPDHQGLNSNSLILSLYTDPLTNVLYAGGNFNTFLGDTADYIVYKSLLNLPVELIFFGGKKCQDGTILSWQTCSEISNDRFEIERSGDGIIFYKIGEVPGWGNSHIVQNYSFVDKSNIQESYYRLNQIDWDGNSKVSNVIFIPLSGNGKPDLHFFGDHLFFDAKERGFLTLYNLLGQKIKKYQIYSGSNDIMLPELSYGSYVVTTSSGKHFHFMK